MNFIRIEPFRGFDNIACKVNSIINEYDKGINIEVGAFSPKVDISEDESYLYLNAELAGIKKEDVKITVNDEHILTITGKKNKNEKNENINNEIKFLKLERNFGEFTRSFKLPLNINKASISASFENGLLLLKLEKIAPKKPKDFEISID